MMRRWQAKLKYWFDSGRNYYGRLDVKGRSMFNFSTKVQAKYQLIASDLNAERDPDFDELEELFLHGDCGAFAVALHQVFHYPINIATYVGKYRGKKSETLIHAAAMKGSTPVDFLGKRGKSFADLILDFYLEARISGELGTDADPSNIFRESNYNPEALIKKFHIGSDEIETAVEWIEKYKYLYS